MANRGQFAHSFNVKKLSTSGYPVEEVEPPVRIELTTAGLPPGERSARLPPDTTTPTAPAHTSAGSSRPRSSDGIIPVVESSWLIEPPPPR